MYTNDIAYFLLGLMSSIRLGKASPALSTRDVDSHLYPRNNPCQPGGTPVLYKEYFPDSCPPALALNSDGSCPLSKASSCTSYCEIKTTFTYDQEIPVVNNPYCHGPLTCTVSESKAMAYTYTFMFNAAWTKAFTAGITGGFSYAQTITQLRSTSVKLGDNECGYFTFLPTLHSSCGSVSEGIINGRECFLPPGLTHANICTTQPARTAHGTSVLGATIFVKTDCGNNQRLPMDQQDPAYQQPGVAQPQSTYNTFIAKFSQ